MYRKLSLHEEWMQLCIWKLSVNEQSRWLDAAMNLEVICEWTVQMIGCSDEYEVICEWTVQMIGCSDAFGSYLWMNSPDDWMQWRIGSYPWMNSPDDWMQRCIWKLSVNEQSRWLDAVTNRKLSVNGQSRWLGAVMHLEVICEWTVQMIGCSDE